MATLALEALPERSAAVTNYGAYHARRFDHLFATVMKAQPDPASRVLDIGPSEFTERLRGHYRSVSTLAFDGGPEHIVYDLNHAQRGRPIPTAGRFDLIVFAEVIEHLYTAPELVLGALRKIMAPGGVLVIQTPNATALVKRLKLLAGRNPYERIRLDDRNPGHFREYTRAELIECCQAAGLSVLSHTYADYFGVNGGPLAQMALAIHRGASTLVPSLARGQTLVARRDGDVIGLGH